MIVGLQSEIKEVYSTKFRGNEWKIQYGIPQRRFQWTVGRVEWSRRERFTATGGRDDGEWHTEMD